MTNRDIKKNLLNALVKLFSKDIFLIENDISERAISHKLSTYLDLEFEEFDVDCEYNGYVEAGNNRKYILMLREKAEELDRIRDSDGDDEMLYRAVYPDIVVHQRGSNSEGSNLLIVEVKKSSNHDTESHDYDKEKLCRYTSSDYENKLNYQLGAFVLIDINSVVPPDSVTWYENGSVIDL